MAYKVELEGGNNQNFVFKNYDDAATFASMAVESGQVEEYHYEKDDDGCHTRVSEGWRPMKVSLTMEGE